MIFDISPAIDEQAEVFPGDATYRQTLHFPLSAECPVNVHTLTLSPHTGAHADAPLHYAAQEVLGGETRAARRSGELPLEPYLGSCRVVHARGFDSAGGCGERVSLTQVAHGLADPLPQRILVRTRRIASQSWSDFSALEPALLDHLARRGVLLVGVDSPSVDTADSKELPSHHALLHHDMRVLENLVLDDVAEGDFELIALPLRLTSSDASPVRAILRTLA